jgi:NIMA (never in mitosis gene a)-related kinase
MSLKNFEILSKLGEGSYSTVFQVKRSSDSQLYALKKVRLHSLKEKEKRNALNEIRILASVAHPNIISYKEAFFDEESRSLCLVMEFADGGDLYQKILSYQKKGVYMSESFIWKLLIELTKGLKALHDMDILHRDLKCANVFLTNSGGVKLGDMNVSKVSKDCVMHTQTGTPYYASPEVWKDIPYDSKSDMWSLGCVIYEAATLKPPFRAEDMEGLYRKVIKGEFSPIPKTFSHELQMVINGLLQVNPNYRLSCSQVLCIPSVVRHMSSPAEDSEFSLLQTIKFPKNIQNISKQLPLPKYMENKPVRNKSTMIPTIRKDTLIPRDQSETKRRNVLNKEILEVQKSKKKILSRDASSAVKLPQVVPRHKKHSAKSLAYKNDLIKLESYLKKPASNRSFLLMANLN